MTVINDSGLEKLNQDIFEAISARVHDGLTDNQKEWAKGAYLEGIIPIYTKFAVDESDAERQERAEIVIEILEEYLDDLSPSEKWLMIIREYFLTKMESISENAFELAQARHLGKMTDVEAAERAMAYQDQLDELIVEKEDYSVPAIPALDDMISETFLDLQFAIEERDVISLRMNRFIENLEKF